MKLTEENKKSIANALLHYVNKNKTSQASIAKNLEVSPAMISNIGKQKFENIKDRNFIKLAAFLDHDINPETPKWRISEKVDAYIQIHNVCNRSSQKGDFLAVYGDTGVGKTTALKKFEKKYSNATYVLVRSTFTRKEFMQAIASALKIDTNQSLTKMIDEVVKTLMDKEDEDGKHVLILDDCSKLAKRCFGDIQALYDLSMIGNIRGFGLVMSGTLDFQRDFERMHSKSQMFTREFKRRVRHWKPLTETKTGVIAGFCKAYDITNQQVIKYLQGNEEFKQLSILADVIMDSLKEVNYAGQEVNLEVVKKITKTIL